MTILDELGPTLTAVGAIITVVLAIIFFFQQEINAQKRDVQQFLEVQNNELSKIKGRTARLELENEYIKEISDLRRKIDELNRELSNLQKRGGI